MKILTKIKMNLQAISMLLKLPKLSGLTFLLSFILRVILFTCPR